MKRYTVTGTIVTLDGGSRVTLTTGQAKTRMHNLKRIDGDVYEVINPVQMKHGETFGYSGSVSKALMTEFKTPEQIKSEAEKAAREEKKAKAKAEAAEVEKKKAEETRAAEKAAALETAIQSADAAVAAARQAVDKLGNKIDPDANAEIEAIIGDMADFAEAGDAEALGNAVVALKDKTAALSGKK